MAEHQCRLCAADDQGALREHLASSLWESRRQPDMDPPWANAGEFWQARFRELASTAIHTLRS